MANVDIKLVAASAEIIASIAVVISLIFVVNSIDQTTAALQSTNDNILYELQDERLSDVSSDGELASIIARFSAGEELTRSELVRFDNWSARELNMWELAFNRHKDGLLPPSQWDAWNDMFADGIPKRISQESWLRRRVQYGEDFADHVDAVYSDQ